MPAPAAVQMLIPAPPTEAAPHESTPIIDSLRIARVHHLKR